MHNNLIATYHSLMTSLQALPDEIAAAQDELTQAAKPVAEAKKTIAAIDDNIETRKAALTLEVAPQGKNDTERKALLTVAVANDSKVNVHLHARRHAETQLTEAQQRIAMLTNDVDNLTRQFAAVGYAAKLHTAMTAYLASAFPGQAMDLDNPIVPLDVNGNGTVTAADAAAAGL